MWEGMSASSCSCLDSSDQAEMVVSTFGSNMSLSKWKTYSTACTVTLSQCRAESLLLNDHTQIHKSKTAYAIARDAATGNVLSSD